jgi:hypothetical protein
MNLGEILLYSPFVLCPLIAWFFIHRRRTELGILFGLGLIFLITFSSFIYFEIQLADCYRNAPLVSGTDVNHAQFFCGEGIGPLILGVCNILPVHFVVFVVSVFAITWIYDHILRRSDTIRG